MPSAFAGAAYMKADLQVHTPRDANWEGTHPQAGISEEHGDQIRAAREEWAKSLIRDCRTKGLDAVAITDHHEGVYIWEVIRAAEGTEVWVFPGMEVTAADSAQALILFDGNIGEVLFEKARSILGLPSETTPSAPFGITVELLDHNVSDIQGMLAVDTELKDRFIILPNVTPGGYKTVLRKGFHKRFRQLPYVGGYLDRRYPHDLDDGDRRILEGEVPAWTSERRGIVTTSDCRHADFSLLGAFPTWIKLAEPTAESLRQAMLAADSRLRYDEPREPSTVVRSIRVSGSQFLNVERVSLSSQFNSLIGGRGSGKSTLLEFIRYALGRSALDGLGEEWDPTHERRRELLEGVLGEAGEVEVEVERDGAALTLTRRGIDHDKIEMKLKDGSPQSLSPRDVRRLVPVQAFSQGVLSHLARSSAEERLLEVLTEPKREELTNVEEEISTATEEITRQVGSLIDFWRLSDQLRIGRAELSTVNARIASIREGLPPGDPEDESLVQNHDAYLRLQDAIEGMMEDVSYLPVVLDSQFDGAISSLSSQVVIDWPSDLSRSAADVKNQVEQLVRQLEMVREETTDRIQDLGQPALQSLETLKSEGEEHTRRYEELMGRLEIAQEQREQLKNLEQRRSHLETSIAEIRHSAERVADSSEKLWSAWETRNDREEERRTVLRSVAANVEQLTNRLARAEFEASPDVSGISEALAHLFEGTYVRDTRVEELCQEVRGSAEPEVVWREVMEDALEIHRWALLKGSEGAEKPRLKHLGGVVDLKVLERLVEKITVERTAGIAKALLAPRLKVYQKRHGEEYDFHKASQGERATTLLILLMNQTGGPLIIDQPEEDLDNRIIGEIVTATRRSKDRRQLIFATHNANLTVNGDAELVIELNRGNLERLGSIDKRDVRQAITVIMEGGKDAFELRRKKYNF